MIFLDVFQRFFSAFTEVSQILQNKFCAGNCIFILFGAERDK